MKGNFWRNSRRKIPTEIPTTIPAGIPRRIFGENLGGILEAISVGNAEKKI